MMLVREQGVGGEGTVPGQAGGPGQARQGADKAACAQGLGKDRGNSGLTETLSRLAQPGAGR